MSQVRVLNGPSNGRGLKSVFVLGSFSGDSILVHSMLVLTWGWDCSIKSFMERLGVHKKVLGSYHSKVAIGLRFTQGLGLSTGTGVHLRTRVDAGVTVK